MIKSCREERRPIEAHLTVCLMWLLPVTEEGRKLLKRVIDGVRPMLRIENRSIRQVRKWVSIHLIHIASNSIVAVFVARRWYRTRRTPGFIRARISLRKCINRQVLGPEHISQSKWCDAHCPHESGTSMCTRR